MKRFALLLAAVLASALQPAAAFAQFDGGPGSRPRAGSVGAARIRGAPVAIVGSNHDVTASRAVNTNYTNATGFPMFVSITFQANTANSGANLNVGGTSISVGQTQVTVTSNISVSGWVPNGVAYQLSTFGTGVFTITHVNEYY